MSIYHLPSDLLDESNIVAGLPRDDPGVWRKIQQLPEAAFQSVACIIVTVDDVVLFSRSRPDVAYARGNYHIGLSGRLTCEDVFTNRIVEPHAIVRDNGRFYPRIIKIYHCHEDPKIQEGSYMIFNPKVRLVSRAFVDFSKWDGLLGEFFHPKVSTRTLSIGFSFRIKDGKVGISSIETYPSLKD